MPLIPREFFSSVRNASRLKKLVIPIGIFFIVMIAAAAMYFYSPSENSVLGENKTPNAPTLSGAWLMKYFLTEDENALIPFHLLPHALFNRFEIGYWLWHLSLPLFPLLGQTILIPGYNKHPPDIPRVQAVPAPPPSRLLL